MEPSGYNFQRYYPFQKDTNKPRWSRNGGGVVNMRHRVQSNLFRSFSFADEQECIENRAYEEPPAMLLSLLDQAYTL